MIQHAIKQSATDAVEAARTLLDERALSFMEDFSKRLAECFANGGKVLVAGNGGSLCDAMHLAEEFTGYFREKRRALPAIALSDPGHMSCVANDAGFETVFSRGVEAHGKPGDVLVLLTTSGNSENLVKAAEAAQKLDMTTVAFLGKSGGRLKETCDLEWIVEGFETSDRIQEAHMAAIHIVIEMVEKMLFAEVAHVE